MVETLYIGRATAYSNLISHYEGTTAMTALKIRSNKYAAQCGTCRNTVAAEAGSLEKIAGKWVVKHLAGECPAVRVAPAKPAGLDLSKIPNCKYMITGEAGQTVHVEVVERRGGRKFVNVLIGSPGDWARQRVSYATQASLVAKIQGATYEDQGRHLVGPEAAAVRFSREYVCCAACMSPLSDDLSRKLGLGPVCRQRFAF